MRIQKYTPPGDTPIGDDLLNDVPCVLCGEPPSAHPFDLVCPMPDPGSPRATAIAPPTNGTARLMYVEQCVPGAPHIGPAWIGRVVYSKSGRSIYYRGMRLRVIPGNRVGAANYRDAISGIGYWVTAVKKRGSNRHPQGGTKPVQVDADVRDEYAALRKHAG